MAYCARAGIGLMLFNSFQFILFFVAVFGLYLALPRRGQNRLLLLSSYLFYGAWDWRFLGLLAFSTVADYYFGRWIEDAPDTRRRKQIVAASMVVNLSCLGFFKYFNFFTENFTALCGWFGVTPDLPTLNVVLPVGISFYTFQSMSYVIDVYRRRLTASRRLEDFALYVAFFPQLVAGPIERATNLLAQITSDRRVSHFGLTHGAYLILWGFFQKIFVADNLAMIVDSIFASGANPAGSDVLLGGYAFFIQIYCDFAGYSNIARGLALCMGFRFMLNFNLPLLATSPTDFWGRWHLSFSSWLRDYLFTPLGGFRKGPLLAYRNLMITMALCGLWHGAAWHFVVWGLYEGLMLAAHRTLIAFKPFARLGEWLVKHRVTLVLCILFRLQLSAFGALLFRSQSMAQVGDMLSALATGWGTAGAHGWERLLFYIAPLFLFEILQYRARDQYVVLKWPLLGRVAAYLVLFYAIVVFGMKNAQSFIYFQF
ncbi:MAG TPA: MBOAT family O-acyltransferase [Kiritimatiellia bacterium]|nr:MBOAT family O-acyltransferase [Kiritimatiellia bacterium]